MANFFKRHPSIFASVIFIFIIALSFGQSLNFELWQDDNALIFKLQHLEEQVGVFGPGAAGLGAYRYIALPYIPIYQAFGMNLPILYFYALSFYFLAGVTVFFLAKQLTKNNILSFLTGAIFSAGFIGSDGILRLFNSAQTSYSIAFVCLFYYFLWRFVQKLGKWDYLMALFLFFISLETAFIRTQYLILPTLVFLILFLSWKKSDNRARSLFLIVPFLLVYNYVLSYSTDSRAGLVKDYISAVLIGKFDYLHSFFGSLGNIVLPQPIQVVIFEWARFISLDYTNRLWTLQLIFTFLASVLTMAVLNRKKIVNRILFSALPFVWFVFGIAFFQDSEFIFTHSIDFDTIGIFSNFIGGLFLIFSVTLILTLARTQKSLAKVSLFLLTWILSNIIAYSTYLPFLPLESINRYLTHSLVPYAIFLPLLLHQLSKKIVITLSSLVALTNIALSVDYQKNFIEEKSVPTQKFYTELRSYIPEIKKGSVLYFDIASDKQSQREFKDFFSVGSMPDTTAIAIRYGIDRYDFQMSSNFDEFLSFTEDKSVSDVYSFFYGTDGLVDTTDLIRSRFYMGQESNGLSDLSTPAIFEFSARVKPQINVSESCANYTQDKALLRSYLLSRDQYYKNVKVETTSQERYLQAKFLVDDESDTLWRGSRGWWNNNQKEEIDIDLGSNKNVGQLVWINGYANSTPTEYFVYVSSDGKIWDSIKEVTEGGKKENGLVVNETFPTKLARYVRLTVTKTFDGDSPTIAEIEVVDDTFKSIVKDDVKILENLAYCIDSQNGVRELNNFILARGIVGIVSWKTDKRPNNSVNFTLIPDGRVHKYRVFLPAGGTRVSDTKIESLQIPAEIIISDSIFHYQPLQN